MKRVLIKAVIIVLKVVYITPQVFELCPDFPLWQRERQAHHGGAIRLYPPEDEMPYNPKGPERSPTFCAECTLKIYDDIVMQAPDDVPKQIPSVPSIISKSKQATM